MSVALRLLRQVSPADRVARWWAEQSFAVKAGVCLLTLAAAVVVPLRLSPTWQAVLFYPVGVYVVLALGLNVVVGQAGLLDLGYVAFYAVGAYTTAKLTAAGGWTAWEALIPAILVASVAGVILGAPTLRLRGDYLAIVTLGFGEIARIVAQNVPTLGQARGITGIPHPTGVLGARFAFDPLPYYYLTLAAAVITVVMIVRLARSRVGRAWAAVREDEDAAEAMGVPTFKMKLWAFAIGASTGGLGGWLYASKVTFINPDNFPFFLSIFILSAVVLGGMGSVPGVIAGAFVIGFIPEYLREVAFGARVTDWLNTLVGGHATTITEYRVLLFGLALIVVMIFRPQGLLPSRQRAAELADATGAGSLGATVDAPGTTADGGEHAAVELPPAVAVAEADTAGGPAEETAGGAGGPPLGGGTESGSAEGTAGGGGGAPPLGGGRDRVPVRSREATSNTATSNTAAGNTAAGNTAAGNTAASDAVLELDGLRMEFGGVAALQGVELEVRRGEIFAVIGPNGAGKTTVFNCVTGVFRPVGGRICLSGRQIGGKRPHDVTQAGVARTFQNIRLFPDMTALQNVMVGVDARHHTSVPGALLGLPRSRREERESRDEARRLLGLVGVAHRADDLARNLPYGDQRRLEIARAVATRPIVLLLDEPAAGMNQVEKQELVGLIRELRDTGLTIVLIEHDMTLVMGVSDRVAVLDFGEKIAEGQPAEVQRNPRVIEAYLGAPAPADDGG